MACILPRYVIIKRIIRSRKSLASPYTVNYIHDQAIQMICIWRVWFQPAIPIGLRYFKYLLCMFFISVLPSISIKASFISQICLTSLKYHTSETATRHHQQKVSGTQEYRVVAQGEICHSLMGKRLPPHRMRVQNNKCDSLGFPESFSLHLVKPYNYLRWIGVSSYI